MDKVSNLNFQQMSDKISQKKGLYSRVGSTTKFLPSMGRRYTYLAPITRLEDGVTELNINMTS